MSERRAIIGVVGAGTMGAGIAQLALEAGHEVVLNDVDETAIERGRDRIRDGLTRRAARLDLDPDSIDEWVDGRLEGLRDALTLDAIGAEAEFVIEAALEDLELKRTVFRTLDAAASPEVVLATNTSALSVGAIAAVTEHPERVLGLHFFNPAPIMQLVEVVVPKTTSPALANAAGRLVESWGKSAVLCADLPGFIVNRVNRPFTLEALAMLEASEASVEAVDAAIRAEGFPMGPFELMDFIGIDVNLAAARGIWEGFGRAERFRPSPIQERLVEEDRLGRKTGSGFYRYGEGAASRTVDPEFAAGERSLAPTEIVERIRLAIAAEAYRALADEVATAADIDLAIRLGAGHREGPFEWAESQGGRSAVIAALRPYALHGARFEPPG
jgi:3-hydroxybutyryl-CoA dehydrogenase